MTRYRPSADTLVSGLAELAATEIPSASSAPAEASRPDKLDKTLAILTVGLWSWRYLLVVLLLHATAEQPDKTAALAMHAITDGSGVIVSLGLYLLLRRSGETRPWPLLAKAAAASVPLSLLLALICQLSANLTGFQGYGLDGRIDPYRLLWGIWDYLWVLLTWSALLVGVMVAFEVRRRDRQIAAMREAAQQAQLLALRLQINPHFLFNTFNTLAGLIVLDRKRDSERMVLNLSRFLRHTLTRTPARLVPLSEEVDMVRMYLDIEAARFGDRLIVRYDVPEACDHALVPSLLLLPLAENSIKYGLGRSEDGIEIRVGARREGDTLLLWLEDSGAGHPESSPGLGIGLDNTRQQLEALYGQLGRLEAGPTHEGWRNALHIPWQEGPQ